MKKTICYFLFSLVIFSACSACDLDEKKQPGRSIIISKARQRLTGDLAAQPWWHTPGHLFRVVVCENKLTGPIPPTIQDCSNLTMLHLGFNQLSGSIPEEIGSLGSLVGLYLSHNQLSGNLPKIVEKLENLEHLAVDNNGLSGHLPEELGNLHHLFELRLNDNQFTGTLPETFSNLKKLVVLDAHNNQLSDALPANLHEMSALESLSLYGNPELTGKIRVVDFPRLRCLSGFMVERLQCTKTTNTFTINEKDPRSRHLSGFLKLQQGMTVMINGKVVQYGL